jgi:signal peptidase II
LPNKTPAGPPRIGALVLLASLAVTALALDQVTKYLVVSNLPLGEQVKVLGDLLILQFVKNPGAAFSLAAGSTWIFSILAVVVTGVILVLARRIRSMGWAVVFGLLLGGVLGNLTDRLFREPSFGLGHVIDFISTPWMIPAIYNIADICIVSSMGLFIILTIRGINLDGTRSVSGKAAEEDATDATAPDAGAPGAGPVEPLAEPRRSDS